MNTAPGNTAKDRRQDDPRRARALKLLQTGQAAASADQFRRIIRASPDSLEDRVLFAQALAQSGEPHQAERELETAIAQAPDQPDLYACLAQVLARTGRRVAAVGHYERALALVRIPMHSAHPYRFQIAHRSNLKPPTVLTMSPTLFG